VEAYRSYPGDRGYPDDHGYPEGQSTEPYYGAREGAVDSSGGAREGPVNSAAGDGSGWYAERHQGDLPSPDPSRRSSPPPTVAEPAPRYDLGRAAGAVPRPGPPPGVEASVPRRAPVTPGSPGPIGEGVYRSRRPAAALLCGVPAALLEIPALMLLVEATFADGLSPSAVIGASCLVLALPLLALGLYSVATGAVRAAGPNSAQAWLRPPVAYLTVALVLFVAAGFAA
jgi:hypothetical protein